MSCETRTFSLFARQDTAILTRNKKSYLTHNKLHFNGRKTRFTHKPLPKYFISLLVYEVREYSPTRISD